MWAFYEMQCFPSCVSNNFRHGKRSIPKKITMVLLRFPLYATEIARIFSPSLQLGSFLPSSMAVLS